jgi:hypothetical protein
MHVMSPETVWTAYLNDLCHTNTTTSEIFEVITLILSECQTQSPWKLVCLSCYLRPCKRCTSQITAIGNTNITSLKFYLCIRTKVFFLLTLSDIKATVKGKLVLPRTTYSVLIRGSWVVPIPFYSCRCREKPKNRKKKRDTNLKSNKRTPTKKVI